MSEGRPRNGFAVLLAVEDEGWAAMLGAEPDALVEAAARAAMARAAPGAPTELAVTLTNDAASRALNAEWRGKDRPTNVLSFPMRALRPGEPPGPLLGDLVLALETVAREAAAERKRPADHARHLIVHGVLHCLGYNHETDDEAEAMERLEALILAGLGVDNPYEAPTASDAGPAAGNGFEEIP